MQNPYSESSSLNPPPASPNSPSRSPEISFDAIGQAWKLLQPNLGTWIGAAFVYLVIIGILNGVQSALSPPDINGVPQIGPVFLVFTLLSFVVGAFLVGGLMRMAINNARTGRAELGQLFSAGDVFLSLVVASILTTIATVIGFVLCFVPGLLLSGLFLFVTPLIVDKKLGAVEAITTSFNTLKPQMWMALLYLIVVGLLAGVGVLACGFGLLLTFPLALLTIAVTYNDFVSGAQSSTPPQMPPSAPIADPFK